MQVHEYLCPFPPNAHLTYLMLFRCQEKELSLPESEALQRFGRFLEIRLATATTETEEEMTGEGKTGEETTEEGTREEETIEEERREEETTEILVVVAGRERRNKIAMRMGTRHPPATATEATETIETHVTRETHETTKNAVANFVILEEALEIATSILDLERPL
eukprot:m.149559 g.149559  ORF g.149559 m.149559 type:complete len:165 (-) comp30665_c1_seq2:239-733(-)